MKCPNCGEEVFDIYTTEQRIKDLYNAARTLDWARNRMRIFAETIEDRLKPSSGLPPIDLKWMANEMRSITEKMAVEIRS